LSSHPKERVTGGGYTLSTIALQQMWAKEKKPPRRGNESITGAHWKARATRGGEGSSISTKEPIREGVNKYQGGGEQGVGWILSRGGRSIDNVEVAPPSAKKDQEVKGIGGWETTSLGPPTGL